MMPPITVGVSLKCYFSRSEARAWFDQIAGVILAHAAADAGAIDVFVIPTYLQIEDALRSFAGTTVGVGAQDVSEFGAGAYTGEITAAELAESNVTYAEVGHAERRRLFGETDEVVATKVTAALSCGITPVLCVGEGSRLGEADAAKVVIDQLHAAVTDAPAGRLIVAYEPVWAIGAPVAAPAEHVKAVAERLREALHALPDRRGSALIYGGSAGPGLLSELGGAVDGVFLGRFGHDPVAFGEVLAEAASLSRARSGTAT